MAKKKIVEDFGDDGVSLKKHKLKKNLIIINWRKKKKKKRKN